ncbi:hypothetical protein FQA39_LY06934 [Lamprigera yunnana]|nr:hypothetical protein FQA39_LY06934 [Lamprigera yunnana]
MEEMLIEKVREHPILYDHGSHAYRDQNIRQAAWEEIGKDLNITGHAAKERWEKLRQCFCNARNRRCEESKSGMASKKKNIWKTQTNLPAAQDYFSEEYEVEENATYELEQGQESGLNFQESQRIDDEVVLAEPGTAEQSLDAVKVLRNKKQKRFTNTPFQQMLEILKESAELHKRKYEEKNCIQQKSRPSSIFENLDDTDVFFLSLTKMTNKLPKYEQAQIKLALSNSVLSAEIRFAQHSSKSNANTFRLFCISIVDWQRSTDYIAIRLFQFRQ